MDVIGVIRNADKEEAGGVALEIEAYLRRRGRRCAISKDGADLPPECVCAVVLGGDGTMLRAAKAVLDRKLPLIGVNLGNLGYLAEIELKTLHPALDRLIAGDYTIEERMMLNGRMFRRGEEISRTSALNEIAISRRKPLRTFRFNISVNGAYLCEYSSDGVILSTATGSTGYNLSAGGPIISPSAEMTVLTPLAPHTLVSRSIVFPGTDRITVRIAEGRTGIEENVAEVRADGGSSVPVGTGDTIEISRSEHHTRIIKINQVSFLDVLRRKMADT